MVTTITREQRQAAKRHIIAQIKQGISVQQARATIDIPMHRATVYQLLKRIGTEGETAFSDGRHGHPIKLRGEVRIFLIEFCRASPHTPSPQVQTVLQERFGLTISVSDRCADIFVYLIEKCKCYDTTEKCKCYDTTDDISAAVHMGNCFLA